MSKSDKKKKDKLIRRISSIFILFILVLGALICRLTYLSIYKSKSYAKKIENQSTETINLNSGRGIIYDRNNKPLTDTKKQKILIVPKDLIYKNYKSINLIKSATDLEEIDIFRAVQEQLNKELIQIDVDTVEKNKEKDLEKLGILIDEKTKRYTDNNLLSHTIGYTQQNKGLSGIEKSMDTELKDGNKKYISAFKAGGLNSQANLNILKGSLKKVSDSGDNLKLTIDSNIQQKVEKIVDKEENPTAVVISDVTTGEILSMTSRPNFNPNDIQSSLEKNDGQLQNRAVSLTYPIGSVFKIVVLYSALENKDVRESTYYYNCTGTEKVGKDDVLHCNNLEGHGIETLSEAFANSCNTAFYDIAKKVGKDKIYESIDKLHLNERVDIGLSEEVNPRIPDKIELNNLAIGQGDLEFTPIQVNQLTQIIANNGLYKPLYIYDSIVDSSMNEVEKIKSTKKEELISPYTMSKIKQFMVGVSKTGTAKQLKDLEGGCGVKTGTAQSSIDNTEINHGWITGFYPQNNPKYAITILVQGTKNNSKSATPIFKEICQSLR